MRDDELLARAGAARKFAYAPYSKFSVGAALLCAGGAVVTGCNVENASYGLSICAERSAVFSAIAAGARVFAAIAIAGEPGATTAPCGACRQVLAEFNGDLHVIYTSHDGVATSTLRELLPARFELP